MVGHWTPTLFCWAGLTGQVPPSWGTPSQVFGHHEEGPCRHVERVEVSLINTSGISRKPLRQGYHQPGAGVLFENQLKSGLFCQRS
jgi:hypothetical protein